MIQNIHIRRILGVLLGGLAGVSLCLSVLPVIMQMAGAGDQTAIAYRLSPYLVYTALIWAAGGWSITRTAVPVGGAFILGTVGLVSGILLANFGLHREFKLLAAGAVGGLFYGFLGGLILGRILTDPSSGEAHEP